jgi:hypothetical protein
MKLGAPLKAEVSKTNFHGFGAQQGLQLVSLDRVVRADEAKSARVPNPYKGVEP